MVNISIHEGVERKLNVFFFFLLLLLIRCVLVFLIKTRILQFFLGAMFGSPSQFTLHHD